MHGARLLLEPGSSLAVSVSVPAACVRLHVCVCVCVCVYLFPYFRCLITAHSPDLCPELPVVPTEKVWNTLSNLLVLVLLLTDYSNADLPVDLAPPSPSFDPWQWIKDIIAKYCAVSRPHYL
jgi:hypothetical protein